MPNTTRPSLLATALPIPGDPMDRFLGVLISMDGKRCLTQALVSVEAAKNALLDPLNRPFIKNNGFDLYEEPYRWVDDFIGDPEYVKACGLYRERESKISADLKKKQAQAANSYKN